MVKEYTVKALMGGHSRNAKKVSVTGAAGLFCMGVEKNGVCEGGRK